MSIYIAHRRIKTFNASSRRCQMFTSEQNKVSKSKAVEKVKPVADFLMSADDIYQKL